MQAVGHLLRPLLVPYTLGSTLVSVPLGLVAYRSTLAFILARRRHRAAEGAPTIPTDPSASRRDP
jgi:hypothetical protein